MRLFRSKFVRDGGRLRRRRWRDAEGRREPAPANPAMGLSWMYKYKPANEPLVDAGLMTLEEKYRRMQRENGLGDDWPALLEQRAREIEAFRACGLDMDLHIGPRNFALPTMYPGESIHTFRDRMRERVNHAGAGEHPDHAGESIRSTDPESDRTRRSSDLRSCLRALLTRCVRHFCPRCGE